jgi:hypothetical protein
MMFSTRKALFSTRSFAAALYHCSARNPKCCSTLAQHGSAKCCTAEIRRKTGQDPNSEVIFYIL